MDRATESGKKEAILDAAAQVFEQYGYRKTSMEDIAAMLGISRASLYSYFENKAAVFRQVSMAVHERALEQAEAWLSQDTIRLRQRITEALLARHQPFPSRSTRSAHRSELHDEYSRRCGDIVAASNSRFEHLLATALQSADDAGTLDLQTAPLSSRSTAEMLIFCVAGLKGSSGTLEEFEARVRPFVGVFLAGLERRREAP
ncbi:MAG: TetR/AcrR family transcriptional regulator [Pseudomonadales bacterium]|nr:TetR/AcrR family transcriptional regulator [Pseudomonadales bacterium]